MDIERRLYLRLFSFCIGSAMDILSYFIDTCILNNTDFDLFLNKHKHKMFHRWIPTIPCCECIASVSLAAPNKRSILNISQMKTVYKLDGADVTGHVKTNHKKETSQHCLCKISALPGITTENLDIGLVHCLIKTCSSSIFSKVQNYLEVIRNIRNELAHHDKRGIMTEIEFNQKWNILENAVLDIAKEVSTPYARKEKKLLASLKKMDVNLTDVTDRIEYMEENMKQEFKIIMDEQTRINDLLQTKADKVKQEILGALEKQKDDLSIEIKKLTFAVKLHGIEHEVESEKPETTVNQREDSERCTVEWRLQTPDTWKVEQIKQTLENVSRMLRQWFYIEFIYVGSLVIHTSVPRHVLRDRQFLKSAIQSFMEKIVEVCEINTDIPETVNVDFTVLDIISHTGTAKSEVERLTQLPVFSKTEYSTDTDSVSCKHCHKQFPCDQCSIRRKQIGFLEEDNRRKTQTITDMQMERFKIESESKDSAYYKYSQLPKSTKHNKLGDTKMEFLKRKPESKFSYHHELSQSKKFKQDIKPKDLKFSDACQLCVSDPRPAVYGCTECVQAMCRECTTVHRTQPTSSTHTTVLLTRDYNFQINGIYISDIARLCEGVLIIIDDRGNQLITSDIRGHNKQFIPLPHLPHTCRLSVIDQNNVAVTTYSHKKVLIVDVRQKNITKAIDIKKYCWGIMYRDNHLYVGCINSLVKVDMSGEIIRTVPLSFIPIYMCSGTEGRIYCSDSHTVYCIDTEGNTVFTVTYPDMLRPCGITTDNEGHVLVVCRLSNNVHRISPDGKQCNVIIKDIPSGIESYPRICYDSISKSVVIGRDDKVYIYKI